MNIALEKYYIKNILVEIKIYFLSTYKGLIMQRIETYNKQRIIDNAIIINKIEIALKDFEMKKITSELRDDCYILIKKAKLKKRLYDEISLELLTNNKINVLTN